MKFVKKIKKICLILTAVALFGALVPERANAETVTAKALDQHTIEVSVGDLTKSTFLYSNSTDPSIVSDELYARINTGGFWSNCFESAASNSLTVASSNYAQINIDPSTIKSDTVNNLNIQYCLKTGGVTKVTSLPVTLTSALKLTSATKSTPSEAAASWGAHNLIEFNGDQYWDLVDNQGEKYWDIDKTGCPSYIDEDNGVKYFHKSSPNVSACVLSERVKLAFANKRPDGDETYPVGVKGDFVSAGIIKFNGQTFSDTNSGSDVAVIVNGCKWIINDYKTKPILAKQYKPAGHSKCDVWFGNKNENGGIKIKLNDDKKVSDADFFWVDEANTKINNPTLGKTFTKLNKGFVDDKDKCEIIKDVTIDSSPAAEYDTGLYTRETGNNCAEANNPRSIKIVKYSSVVQAGVDPLKPGSETNTGNKPEETPKPPGPCETRTDTIDGKQVTVFTTGKDGGDAPTDSADANSCLSECNDTNGSCFYNVLQTIINFLTAGIGLVVVINIIIGGMQYILSDGNASDAVKGRKRIENSLLGFAAYALMYGVLSWLIPGGIAGK
jgi:hypothetical protein